MKVKCAATVGLKHNILGGSLIREDEIRDF